MRVHVVRRVCAPLSLMARRVKSSIRMGSTLYALEQRSSARRDDLGDSRQLLCVYQKRHASKSSEALQQAPAQTDTLPNSAETVAENDDEEVESDDESTNESRAGFVEVYHGPFERAVRMTKILSVSSCGLTTFGAPLLAYSDPSTTAYAVAALIMTFGFGTTSALHFFIKPYVRVARFNYGSNADNAINSDDPVLEIEQFTLFARVRKNTIRASEASIPENIMRPMTTMYAKKNPIFINFDGFHDKQLLARFVKLPASDDKPEQEDEEPDSAEEEEVDAGSAMREIRDKKPHETR